MHANFKTATFKSDKPVVDPNARRRWLKLNVPMCLDAIIACYVLLTLLLLGDDAIRGRNPTASISVRRHFRPVPVGNAVADLGLLAFPQARLFEAIHGIPDLAVCVVLAALTAASLHLAALGDPGIVPRSWGMPADPAAIGPGSPGYDVACDPMSGGLPTSVMSPVSNPNSHGGGAADSNGTPIANSSASGAAVATATTAAAMSSASSGASPVSPLAASAGWSLCDKAGCDTWRPPRAHHCRECQVCIARYDHHCMWIDSCVGYRNHRCFWLFLVYILACIGHAWAMFVRFWLAESIIAWSRSSHGLGPLLLMLCYYMVVLSTTVFAFIFLVNTTINMLRDTTTVEEMSFAAPRHAYHVSRHASLGNGNRSDRGSDDDDDSGADDGGGKGGGKSIVWRVLGDKCRRGYRNFCSVMGPPWLWWLPYLRTMTNPLLRADGSVRQRARQLQGFHSV